jgi:hypothetical protein
MTGNTSYDNAFPKVDVSKESVIQLLAKMTSFKLEERELALDRFKRVNNDMETNEDFWAHGKNAVLYLNSASQSTDALIDMTKEIMKIAYKDNVEGLSEDEGVEMTIGDKEKMALSKIVEEQLKAKRNNKNKSFGEEDEDKLVDEPEV